MGLRELSLREVRPSLHALSLVLELLLWLFGTGSGLAALLWPALTLPRKLSSHSPSPTSSLDAMPLTPAPATSRRGRRRFPPRGGKPGRPSAMGAPAAVREVNEHQK